MVGDFPHDVQRHSMRQQQRHARVLWKHSLPRPTRSRRSRHCLPRVGAGIGRPSVVVNTSFDPYQWSLLIPVVRHRSVLVASVRDLRGMSPLITCWKAILGLGNLSADLRAITDCHLVLLLGRVCGAESE